MLKVILLLTMAFSCLPSKNNKTLAECEELSMKRYRGFPKASYEFEKYCFDKKIKHTPLYCQKALEHLIKTGETKRVIKKFGKKSLGCFNKSDLKNFVKKKGEW